MTIRRGPDVGRTRLTITGTGFAAITKVLFGSSAGTSLSVASSTRLGVTAPAHAAGAVAVRVVGAYGTSPSVEADRYTYLDTTAPRPVTALTVTAVGTGLALTWTNPAGPDLAGMVVRRNPGATAPATAGSGTAVANLNIGITRIVDNGVTHGLTYTYSVFAHDAVPNYATPATVSAIAPTPPDTTAPDPVADLTATVAPPGTAITLTWTNPTDDDLADIIVRRANGGTAPATPNDGDPVTVPTDPGNSVTDTGLTYDTQYSYAVFARDGVPNVSPAATAAVTTAAIAPVAGLSATPTGNHLLLDWTNPADPHFAGTLIRAAQGTRPPGSITDGSAVDTTTSGSHSYLDNFPPTGSTLSYSVFARNVDGGYSVATTVTVVLPPAPPDLSSLYSLGLSNSTANVGWQYGTGSTGVRVALCWELQLQPNSAVDCRNGLTYVFSDYPFYEITGLVANSRYGVLAYAIDSAGRRSATGTSLFVQTAATPSPVSALLGAPVNDRAIRLEWGGPQDSPIYDQFVVRRAVGSTPPSSTTGELVATLPRSRPVVVDRDVTASTRYSYSVFTRTNSGGISDPVTVQVTTPAADTGWQPAQAIDPPAGGLTSLSCATRDFCAAVDFRGHTVTWNGTQWSPVHREDPARYFLSVSCASAVFCVAVDDRLNWVSWDGERWTDHGTVDPSVPAADIVAVSCSTASFCVAVSGEVAVRFDGTAWSSPTPIDPGQRVSDISCPVAGRCTAMDGKGRAVALAEGQWSAPTPALAEDSSYSKWKNLISCASVSFCVAADVRGSVAVFDGVWHAPTRIRTGSDYFRRRSPALARRRVCSAVCTAECSRTTVRAGDRRRPRPRARP